MSNTLFIYRPAGGGCLAHRPGQLLPTMFASMYNPLMSSPFDEKPLAEIPIVVLDTETTGLHPGLGDRVVEIGGLRLEGGQEVAQFDRLIYPERRMNPEASAINRIYDEDLAGQPTFGDIADEFLDFVAGAVLVAHNAVFDANFLGAEMFIAGRAEVASREPALANPWICTLQLARRRFHFGRNNLGTIARRLQVRTGRAHRALADVYTTAGVLKAMARQLEREQVTTVGDLFHAQGGAVYAAPPPDIELPRPLATAIAERQMVNLLYVERDSQEIAVTPLYAMRHQGVPYLIAKLADRGELRFFQLNFIFGVTPLA